MGLSTRKYKERGWDTRPEGRNTTKSRGRGWENRQITSLGFFIRIYALNDNGDEEKCTKCLKYTASK